MRIIPIAAITFAGLLVSSIGAHAGTWCSQYGGGRSGGGMNCGFYSFDQCQANVRGIGGFCIQNPFSAYGYAGRQTQRRYQRER
jgi:hypothetical protein